MDNGRSDHDDVDREGLLEAARAIRPYLPDLVGPAADQVDHEIAELLAAHGRGDNVIPALWSLLARHAATRDFVTEVLADEPHYRPPGLQPGYQCPAERGTPGTHLIAGNVGPVHVGKYLCPKDDYIWYRPAVGVTVPLCPTHGRDLIRA
ncbi:MAG: hypothetical protein ACLPN6_31160 [Streptosporangiaceae bacterium]|nr:hypothetical protein [Streptosporangiaceae bacterium]